MRLEFKPIGDCYRIGNDGSIWSWKCEAGTKTKRWKELFPWTVKGGYQMIGIHTNEKRKCTYIHLLVLTSFTGPCPEGMEACHNNSDPKDNRLENLRWDTPKNNSVDRAKNGIHQIKTKRGEDHGMAKLRKEEVNEIRDLFSKGTSRKELSRKFNIGYKNLCDIVAGKIWKEI